MRFSQILIYGLFLLFLPACTGTDTVVPATPTRQPSLLTDTPLPPTKTQLPNSPTPTSTLVAPISTSTPTPQPVLQLCSPLAEQTLEELSEIVSDPYNPPRPGKDDRHHGVDLAYYQRKDRTTIEGEVVQALLAGQIVAISDDRLPYGNMVMIETQRTDLSPELIAEFGIAPGESLYHLYAHFGQKPLVQLGEWVKCGQALGQVGATGYNIVNAHLHLETRLGPANANFSAGMVYYDTRASEQERANYELWRTSGVFQHFDPMALINWYFQNPTRE